MTLIQAANDAVLCEKRFTDDDGREGMLWVVWHHAAPTAKEPWVGTRELAWKQHHERLEKSAHSEEMAGVTR